MYRHRRAVADARLIAGVRLTDTGHVMIHDLQTILDGWEYEPGKISVRKIIGRDGQAKIQTRVDLGVLQLEIDGRPDGERPHGFSSLLEYQEHELRRHVQSCGCDAGFELSAEDCHELRLEAYLYYQRYLSLFVLEEFDGVHRDTERNLRLIDLIERYATRERDREAFGSQRAYVLMMNIRARAYDALGRGAPETALATVTRGIARVRGCTAEDCCPADEETAPEVEVLEALQCEVLHKMSEDAPARLHYELDAAVVAEDFERAAELRDKLDSVREKTSD